ncbi:MAG: hypothetical protein WA708_07260 [Acidobacteriaceae bacterium]
MTTHNHQAAPTQGRKEFPALAAKIDATTSKSSEDDTISAIPGFLDCDFFELYSSMQGKSS